MKTNELLLKRIAKDIGLIKREVVEIKGGLKDLATLEVRSNYVKKLKRLEKHGKFSSYRNIRELRKEIENV